jgi:phosphate transport system substrate-binding protein
LPLTANAIITTYNLPELSSNDTLVFNLPTLARIYCGDITSWNDSAIAELNPSIQHKLPDANILLTYKRNPDSLGSDNTAAFIKALAHDPVFAAALEASNGSLSDIVDGAGFPSDDVSARMEWVNKTDHSLGCFTLSNSPTPTYAAVRVASMISTTDNITLWPTTATVQAAMSYFRAAVFNNTFLYDISNGGSGCWPLSFLSSVAIIYANDTDQQTCPSVQEILDFAAWTQINDNAVKLAQAAGYVPLDIAYRRTLIDTLSSVMCHDNRATTSAYVIGMGGPLPVYTSWASSYTDDTFRMKYYPGDAFMATRYMQSGSLSWPL